MIKFLKLIFYFSTFLLIAVSLYPGSLIGYLLYSDLSKEIELVQNPIGTSINHFIYYFYLTILGSFIYVRSDNFKKMTLVLFFLSFILEISHLIVPNRAFQLYDLISNFLGVLVAYFLVKLYLNFKML